MAVWIVKAKNYDSAASGAGPFKRFRMKRRDFLKRLAGAFIGLALVEGFHLNWLRQRDKPAMCYGLDYSPGKDYSAVVVLDKDGEVQPLAFSTDAEQWAEVMEWCQRIIALGFGVDPTFLS
jgi:hypothetical protein